MKPRLSLLPFFWLALLGSAVAVAQPDRNVGRGLRTPPGSGSVASTAAQPNGAASTAADDRASAQTKRDGDVAFHPNAGASRRREREAPQTTAEQWGIFELTLHGPADGNPFVEVNVSATFSNGERSLEVPGFYDGDGVYRVRFMPEIAGTWRYETHSNRWPLTGKIGSFVVVSAQANATRASDPQRDKDQANATGASRPQGEPDQTNATRAVPTPEPWAKAGSRPQAVNHGPVRVHNTYHFAYADGTPYRPFGTTIYNWIYKPEALQEQTLQTLATSPFNKVRMMVLPTNGVGRPPDVLFPFPGHPPKDWDTSRYDPAFFRHLEQRVGQLRDFGVEADVILFNPYDEAFGFDRMDAAANDRFARYVVARLAAYRNVWWSLANEYDYARTMREADWDRLFQVVQQADPYQHLRSIHNGSRLYDNAKPWVTHASIQNGAAVEEPGRAEMYRDVWEKPVVYDEVKYEGRMERRWGNLTGQELVHRFWCGTVAGTYVGHGETLRSSAGTSWLGNGGTLVGESPARIAFLRKIVEDSPAGGINPIDKWQDPTIGGTPGEYYLVYLGREAPTSWPFHLPKAGVVAGQQYRVEVIDTWAMTITPADGPFTAKRRDSYTFTDANDRAVPLPGKPYLALRIRRVSGPAAAASGETPVEP